MTITKLKWKALHIKRIKVQKKITRRKTLDCWRSSGERKFQLTAPCNMPCPLYHQISQRTDCKYSKGKRGGVKRNTKIDDQSQDEKPGDFYWAHTHIPNHFSCCASDFCCIIDENFPKSCKSRLLYYTQYLFLGYTRVRSLIRSWLFLFEFLLPFRHWLHYIKSFSMNCARFNTSCWRSRYFSCSKYWKK